MKKITLKSLLLISLSLAIATIAFAAVYDVPSEPGVPYIQDTTDDSCDLKYEAPKNDGGAPIVSYLIERRRIGDNIWVSGGVSKRRTHTVMNLIYGNEYEFRVKAANKVGISQPSRVSSPVIIGLF